MPPTPARDRRAAPAVARCVGPTTAAVVGAGVVAASVGRLLRTAGATDAEVAARLPGDGAIADPDAVTTRAVTIAAPATAVWPWLAQLGWGRAGWYSLDAVERLVGAARSVDAHGRVSWRSLRTLVPAHQDLGVGDLVPLADGVGLTATVVEPPHALVLELDRRVLGRRLRWAWTLVVREDGPRRSRLVARTRTAIEPGGVGSAGAVLLLDAGHAVMELVQLRGVRDRVEATATDGGTR